MMLQTAAGFRGRGFSSRMTAALALAIRSSEEPIIDELNAVREAIAAEFGYDMNKIAEWMRAQQNSGNREAVTFPPKHVVDKKAS